MGNSKSSGTGSREQQQAVHEIVSMGFSQTQAVSALQAANGNTEAAVNLLLTSGSETPAPAPIIDLTSPSQDSAAFRERQRQRDEQQMAAAIAESERIAQLEAQQRAQAEARRRQEEQRKQAMQRVAAGSGSGSSSTQEQELKQYASLLASQPTALDTLVSMLTQIMSNPSEPRFRKVYLSNKAFTMKVSRHPGALEFLRAVGFTRDEAAATMTLAREDTALLWMGKSMLEAQKDTSEYARAKEMEMLYCALDASKETSMEEVRKRRELLRRRLPAEPSEGQGGTSKICFHIGEQRVWRNFDSDETLATLISFVTCLEKVDPFQSWQLVNITTFPHQVLDVKDAQRTLQTLALWPSGQVKVQLRAPAGSS